MFIFIMITFNIFKKLQILIFFIIFYRMSIIKYVYNRTLFKQILINSVSLCNNVKKRIFASIIKKI